MPLRLAYTFRLIPSIFGVYYEKSQIGTLCRSARFETIAFFGRHAFDRGSPKSNGRTGRASSASAFKERYAES